MLSIAHNSSTTESANTSTTENKIPINKQSSWNFTSSGSRTDDLYEKFRNYEI
jgi:hypothetical protein